MKQIYVAWTEEMEYSATLEVPNNLDIDDYEQVRHYLAKLAGQGKLQPDDSYGNGRVVEDVQIVED